MPLIIEGTDFLTQMIEKGTNVRACGNPDYASTMLFPDLIWHQPPVEYGETVRAKPAGSLLM